MSSTDVEPGENREARQRFNREIDDIKRSAGWLRLWLESSSYKPLWHTLAVIAIVVAACFIFYKNFGSQGMLMSPDMTWPDSLSRLQFGVTNTWFPYGSSSSLGNLQLFLWIYPTSSLAKLLGLSAANYMFIMFLGTFSIAGISMYVLAYRTIHEIKVKDISAYAPFLGAVLAAIVYMYNPWSVRYLKSYFAYPLYAFLPLIFLALARTFANPTFRNIFLFTVFVAIVNTSDQVVWSLGFLLMYFIYYLVRYKFTRETVTNSLRAVLGIPLLYLLLGAFWTVPYLGSLIALGKPPVYNSPVFAESALSGLSLHSPMSNNLRLLPTWAWRVEQVRGGAFLEAVLFSLPLFAILGLVLLFRQTRKNNTVNFLAVVATVTLLLATGTSWILSGSYKYLVNDAPGASTYGWLLRSTEKWLFFVPVFFSLMLGLLIARLLVRRPSASRCSSVSPPGEQAYMSSRLSGGNTSREEIGKDDRIEQLEHDLAFAKYRRNMVAAVVIAIMVLVSMYPVAYDFAQKVFNPVNVPRDYSEVNEFIDQTGGQPRVAWLPFFPSTLFNYQWAPWKKAGPFGIISSNANLNSLAEVGNQDSYYNWLEALYVKDKYAPVKLASPELTLKNDNLSRLLIPFSTGYVIHDQSVKGQNFAWDLSTEGSLEEAHSTEYLKVYLTDDDPSYMWPATRTLNAESFFDNLALIQKLPHAWTANLAFTDGRSYSGATGNVGEDFGGVELREYMELLNRNSEFEEVDTQESALYWAPYFESLAARITTDKRVKVSGKRSLRIENNSAENLDLARVVSDGITVPSQSICAIETTVRYENSNWTNVAVEGYDSATGQWVQIAQCPTIGSGDRDWKQYYCSFWLPPGISTIRSVLSAGWVKDPGSGSAVSWFDDIKLYRFNDLLYAKVASTEQPPEVTFERLGAEKYRVRVRNAGKPFVLLQSEAFDPLWVARLDGGETVESIPMYSTINGYPLERTGDFDLTIEYRPQRWCSIGFIISGTTLLVCLLFIVFDWKLAGEPPERRKKSRIRRGKPQSASRKPRRFHPLATLRELIEGSPRSGIR